MRKAFGFLSLCLTCALSAVEVTLVTVEGNEIEGTLESVKADAVRVQGKDVATGDLAEIRFRNNRQSVKDQVAVRLRSGDVLYGTVTAGGEEQLSLKTSLLGEIKIKNDLLNGLAFPIKEPPSDEALDQFFAAASADHDQLLTPRGETVDCFLSEMTDKELRFDVQGQKRVLPFEKVAAFRYAALDKFTPLKGVLARVHLADGSRFSGRLEAYAEKQLTLAGAQEMKWKVPESAILSVAFAGGRLVYLDQLKPKVEQKPYVGGAPLLFRWRKNESAAAGPLAIGRKEYLRGLGVHSFCKLSFDLEGQYARLLVDVGLDRAASARGACSWKILADGKELKSGEAKAGGVAVSLKLPVAGVKILELVCDYGPDQDDAGDFLDWAEARLVKN